MSDEDGVGAGATVAVYLGDAVYARLTGFAGEVKLWTEREEGTHWMVLGPTEIEALLQFLKTNGWRLP